MIVRKARYLHISFLFFEWVDLKALERLINDEALDWLRWGTSYIVWTDLEAHSWTEKLLAFPKMQSNYFFICALDLSDRGGWLPESIWDWLLRNRPDSVPARQLT